MTQRPPPARAVPPRRAIPVVALIVLIALTIALFGTDATGGPLQVALLTSAVVAGLVAFKNGHSSLGPRRRDRRHLVGHGRGVHPARRSAR